MAIVGAIHEFSTQLFTHKSGSTTVNIYDVNYAASIDNL